MQNSTRLVYASITAITILMGALIAWGILSTQWQTEAIKMALEKGQNPLYVKCAYDSSSEACKNMIMSMSLSGQFKDSSAPAATPVPKK